MDEQQAQLVQAFMLDLGIVLGAKSEQEALAAGQAAVKKLGENAGKLFQAWGQAEAKQQGSGRQVIAEALGGNTQAQQPATVGSMQPTYNAAPTPTPYGDTVSYAKLGTKIKNISRLNGHCPEGYEVEKYLAGGCVKCRKGKQLETMVINSKKRFSKKENDGDFLKCGGKKARIKKHDFGGILDYLRKLFSNSQTQVDPSMVSGYYESDPTNGSVVENRNGVRRNTRPMSDGQSITTYTGQNGVMASKVDNKPFESNTERQQYDSLQNVFNPSLRFYKPQRKQVHNEAK